MMVKLYFLFGCFLVGMAGIGLLAYVVLRDMSAIRKALGGSEVVQLFSEDFCYSKLLLELTLCGVVMLPARHLAEGTLQPENLDAIPRPIILRIKISFWLLSLSMLVLLVMYVYVSAD